MSTDNHNPCDNFPGVALGSRNYQIGKAHVVLRRYEQDDIGPHSLSGMEIRTIKVPQAFRRQGEARKAMEAITSWADQTKTVLYVLPEPFDDAPMSERQLKRFYRNMGFLPYRFRIMQRKPHEVSLLRKMHSHQ